MPTRMSNRSPTIERADSVWLPIFQSGSFQPCNCPLGLPIRPTGTASDTSARAALAQSTSFCNVGAPLRPVAPTISPSTLMGNPPPHAAIRATRGQAVQKRRGGLDGVEKFLRGDAEQRNILLVLRNLDAKDRGAIHPAKGL